MSRPAEPIPADFSDPLLRYFAATRPAFLSVTFTAALLGLATAFADGITPFPLTAMLTVSFALIAHAGINVLNDYYDAQNGTDAINTERQFPFTGGSRFIQNGVLTQRATGVFGYALLAAVVPVGLWLAHRSGAGLMWIGLAGLFVGWAYSAPPLRLMSRGLGELAVAGGWLIVVIGADYVQRGAFSWTPLAAGLSYALHVSNVLYINQFPDYRADAAVGKRNWVVRLGPVRARWIYPLTLLAAYGWLLAMVVTGRLHGLALLAFIAGVPAIVATRALLRHAQQPSAAAMLHGLLLAAALVAARLLEA